MAQFTILIPFSHLFVFSSLGALGSFKLVCRTNYDDDSDNSMCQRALVLRPRTSDLHLIYIYDFNRSISMILQRMSSHTRSQRSPRSFTIAMRWWWRWAWVATVHCGDYMAAARIIHFHIYIGFDDCHAGSLNIHTNLCIHTYLCMASSNFHCQQYKTWRRILWFFRLFFFFNLI